MRARALSRSLLAALAAWSAVLPAAVAQPAGDTAASRLAVVGTIDGPIGPATTRYVEEVLEAARERRAEVVVLQIDTPGGLSSSMRDIIRDILASPVPVVGYVAPSGARAASAGTYILYATHVAAMAPGTNMGAATPVQLGGGGLPGLPGGEGGKPGGDKDKSGKSQPSGSGDTLMHKATNDAVAFIRSLAQMRGRNVEWAEQAVREAATLTAGEAKRKHVIELIAPSLPMLLDALDGRTVSLGEAERTLHTRDAVVEQVELGVLSELLAILANPNVAFILLMLGTYGLIFEFANPGSVAPGVVGTICLILGLFALNQLPLNYAGLALILLGVGLMVAEAVTPTFGVLGVGGVAAFVIGAAMLLEHEAPGFRLSWWTIGGTAAATGGLLVLLLGYLWRAHRRPIRSGAERLAGASARVVDWSGLEGYVWAEGERWHARGAQAFRAGETVRVERKDGLTLVVGPAGGGAGAGKAEGA